MRELVKTRNDNGTFDGKTAYKYSCDACTLVRINGIVCHEHGCPEAWRDTTRQCRECGCDFIPEERYQQTDGCTNPDLDDDDYNNYE